MVKINSNLNKKIMYKDIITYELAENVTKEQLIKIAKQIVNDWMKNQVGFIKWEIHTNLNLRTGIKILRKYNF